MTIPVHEGCENRLSSGISSGITSKSAKRIYQTIADNPVITTLSIAQELNLSERYVEKHIKELKELGLIERIGPKTKGGGWRIVEKWYLPQSFGNQSEKHSFGYFIYKKQWIR